MGAPLLRCVNYIPHAGSCKQSRCCERIAEGRGAKSHATIRGNRGIDASSYLGGEQFSFLPRPIAAQNPEPETDLQGRRALVVRSSMYSASACSARAARTAILSS